MRLSSALVAALTAMATVWALVRPGLATARTHGVGAWWSAQDPLDAAAFVGGWVAFALLAWMALITLLQLVALAARWASPTGTLGERMATVVSRSGPRAIAGLAASAVLAGATAACAAPGQPVAAGSAAPEPGLEMVLEQSGDTPVLMEMEPVPAPTAHPSDPAPAPTPPTVVAERGDSLWRIAEREVSARAGRPATDDETAPYWRVLVELNRAQLVDPDDPGLIYPGQRFVVP